MCLFYFNNCCGRPHRELFADDRAFYDLDPSKHPNTTALGLTKGGECVVASYNADGSIRFARFVFDHERIVNDSVDGEPCRVLYGEFCGAESLSKKAAASHDQYGVYFNVNGDFKQQSVVAL